MLLLCTSTGGVGIAATQLCQTVQDVTVFGTASAAKHETIVQGGVTHPIDYRTKDYVEEIRKISPKGENTHTHTHTHLSVKAHKTQNPYLSYPTRKVHISIIYVNDISVSFVSKSSSSLFLSYLFLFLILSAGVDIVLDPLNGSDTQKGFSLLKPLGTIVVFGKMFRNRITGFSAFVQPAFMFVFKRYVTLSTYILNNCNGAGLFHFVQHK